MSLRAHFPFLPAGRLPFSRKGFGRSPANINSVSDSQIMDAAAVRQREG